MQQFGCILVFRLAGSSTFNGHVETAPVHSPYDHHYSNETHSPPMLQLMSLSLDNWGAVHAEPHVVMEEAAHSNTLHKLPDLALYETAPLPLLSLMSLNLDNWGSKETQSGAEVVSGVSDAVVSSSTSHSNPLVQIATEVSNHLFDFRALHLHSIQLLAAAEHAKTHWVSILVFAVILVVLTVFACYVGHWDGICSSRDDHQNWTSPEVEQDFAAVEFSDGSWAQVYREAKGEQKEALELLFRCNIISTEEFAFSSVNQEHIQECIWIATHMLNQKPLEEWVALWQQAQQTFEDSVTACFEARGGPYSSPASSMHLHPSVATSNTSLGAVPLAGRSNRLMNTSTREEEDEDIKSPQAQEFEADGVREPDSERSVGSEQTRRSIESEVDADLAQHSGK